MKNQKKVVLITGASAGIGQACATHLHSQGYIVYGTSRRAKAGSSPESFKIIPMDVCDENSVKQAVDSILKTEGRLDIVVNNAGISIGGAVEDISINEYKKQFDTNFYGVLRVCQVVLPVMREQKSGLIVNVSSVGGQLGIPFDGAYSASKFALEGVTEASSMEVQSFGVKVVLLQPGDVNTGMTARNFRAEQSESNPVYLEKFNEVLNSSIENESDGCSPKVIAQTLEKIINTSSPGLRYASGDMMSKIIIPLKRVLPSRMFEKIIMKNYGLG